jgi:hypothetical protein
MLVKRQRLEGRLATWTMTLRYDEVLFILDPTDLARTLAGNKVVVCDYPDGRLEITHEGTSLPYRIRPRWLFAFNAIIKSIAVSPEPIIPMFSSGSTPRRASAKLVPHHGCGDRSKTVNDRPSAE